MIGTPTSKKSEFILDDSTDQQDSPIYKKILNGEKSRSGKSRSGKSKNSKSSNKKQGKPNDKKVKNEHTEKIN